MTALVSDMFVMDLMIALMDPMRDRIIAVSEISLNHENMALLV